MAEENQVTTKKVETGKRLAEENQVTTKDPKKVEAGKKLAEYNRRKREAQKIESKQVEPMLTYSTGAVLAVGVIGDLNYYVYKAKVNNVVSHQPQQPPKSNKFEME